MKAAGNACVSNSNAKKRGSSFTQDILIQKNLNPAKEYLSAYRWALKRRDAILAEIEYSYDAASRATSRLKAVMVSGTPSHDGMANAVCRVVDAKQQLEAALQDVNRTLAQVLEAIESMEEGAKKTVLFMRYVNCLSWDEIARKLSYERTQVFVIHGKALLDIEKFLKCKSAD